MNFNNSYKTYKTNGRVSIYQQPKVNISKTGKITNEMLTTESYNVNVVSGDTMMFDFIFDYDNDLNKKNTVGYKYEVLKYNPSTNSFNQRIYRSEIINLIEGFGQEFPTSNLFMDGDYLIKSYFLYEDNKLFKNVFYKKGNGDTGKDKKIKYDDGLDNYFVAIKPSEKPNIFADKEQKFSGSSVIKSKTFQPKNGEDTIVIKEVINGEILVSFNGLVLSKDLDFTFKNNTLKLKEKTRVGDIINLFYCDKDSPLSVEVIDVLDLENQKEINFNEEKGRYELYILKGLKGDKEIISVNGLVLSPDIDYVRSITDDTKIIFMGDIKNGDIINVVYTARVNLVGNTTTDKPTIGWYIKDLPKNIEGKFILEISKTSDFSELVYTKEIPYKKNELTYSVKVDGALNSFTKYYYRVKNVKTHKTVNHSLIELEAISEEYWFEITNNKINSY